MKKFVIGVIVGAVLMFSGQAFGAINTLIGKKVSSELFVDVNGKNIGKGVVISNKTYLPVREVANAFNADIGIEEGGVSLTTETVTDTVAIESQKAVDLEVLHAKKIKIEEDIEKAKVVIVNFETKTIPRTEDVITRTTDPQGIINLKEQVEEMKNFVAEKKASIPVLEAELAEVISKIAELEAQ